MSNWERLATLMASDLESPSKNLLIRTSKLELLVARSKQQVEIVGFLANKDIFGQDDNSSCASGSLINLLKCLGLPAPSLNDVNARIDGQKSLRRQLLDRQDKNRLGASLEDLAVMLSSHGVLCALVTIPPQYRARPETLLKQFLDHGCLLIIAYRFEHGGSTVQHAVVCEGYSDAQKAYYCVDSREGGKRVGVYYQPCSADEPYLGLGAGVIVCIGSLLRQGGEQSAS